jgi:hypothetical protein
MNEEVRRARAAARRLSEPAAALTALLSAGEGLRHLAAESPEDLPLVAFSPFGGLPEPPARASAGGFPEAARGGRAPALPKGLEKAAPPTPAAAPAAASRPSSASVSHSGGPESAPRPPAPVFPLRPRADLRPAADGRAGNGKAATRRADGGAVTPRSLLELLASGPAAEGAAANGGSEPRVPAVREPGGAPGASGASGASRPEGHGEPGRTAARPQSGRGTMALPVPDLLETLLESAERAGRRRPAPPPSPSERRPDGAAEVPADAPPRFRESSAAVVAGAQAVAEERSAVPEPFRRAALPSPPVSTTREPALSLPAPDAAFDAPLDGELLADLVNEALIEQARRHGVDLS